MASRGVRKGGSQRRCPRCRALAIHDNWSEVCRACASWQWRQRWLKKTLRWTLREPGMEVGSTLPTPSLPRPRLPEQLELFE